MSKFCKGCVNFVGGSCVMEAEHALTSVDGELVLFYEAVFLFMSGELDSCPDVDSCPSYAPSERGCF